MRGGLELVKQALLMTWASQNGIIAAYSTITYRGNAGGYTKMQNGTSYATVMESFESKSPILLKVECNDCEETEFVVYLNVYATESSSTGKHQIHICV